MVAVRWYPRFNLSHRDALPYLPHGLDTAGLLEHPAHDVRGRQTTAPAVRHAMRINSVTTVFEHTVASHAAVCSKR